MTAVNGVPIKTWNDFRAQTEKQTGTFAYTVERDGRTFDVQVTPQLATVYPEKNGTPKTVAKVGVGQDFYGPVQYNILSAIPASAAFTGQIAVRTVESLAQMPSKVVDLWHAVTGGIRDPETPVSVYGASKIGGETAEHGLWSMFILTLASLNFFLGAFNLLPLLPLDGGHMAVVIYEKLRNLFRNRKGLPTAPPSTTSNCCPPPTSSWSWVART